MSFQLKCSHLICAQHTTHRYLIDNFGMTSLAKYNKLHGRCVSQNLVELRSLNISYLVRFLYIIGNESKYSLK